MADNAYEVSWRGGVTTVGALPIGLDVDKILAEVTPGKTLRYQVDGESLGKRIQADKDSGCVVFGGLERRDYTKGLLERLRVFLHAYNRLAEGNRKARFYQASSPSRMSNPEYRYLHTLVADEVAKVNRRLPEEEPILHLDQGIPSPQNYRFMRVVDVMLVTPLEDGMNLVAFEYILSQKHKDPGQRGLLALSTSGASRVLEGKGFGLEDGVVFINPLKPKEAGRKIAEAVENGYGLSDRVVAYVENERRVDDWAEKNISAILNARPASS